MYADDTAISLSSKSIGDLQNVFLFHDIGDQDIEMITNKRYLGVQIDSKLDWDKHIDTIKTKANRALGLIKYSKKYLPSDILNKMYRGIVEPHLSYCCSVWGCCNESKLDVL